MTLFSSSAAAVKYRTSSVIFRSDTTRYGVSMNPKAFTRA